MSDEELVLPPLQDAMLAESDVLALAEDLRRVADVIGHATKGGATTRATEARSASLEADVARLLAGEVAGLQVRYRHDGKEWWDTLLALGEGRFRLVRIEHVST